MKQNTKPVWILLILVLAGGLVMANEPSGSNGPFRILSWNISGDAYVSQPTAFRNLLILARPDILLLDEVSPSAGAEILQDTLTKLRPGLEETWHIDFGKSGGRQRGVIASRVKLESLPEFSQIVPYPEADRRRILQHMSPRDRSHQARNMDSGIPVNGAVVLISNRRLLVVVADLQCCGNGPGSWQEFRRRVEAREISQVIQNVLAREQVDGLVVAGDFNLVATSFPMEVLTGPYPPRHKELTPVEIYHLDGSTTWTWDGRGTPFPSSVLDFQLFEAQALQVRGSFILDTEDYSSEELQQYGFQSKTSSLLSNHRPLVVSYIWR